MGTIQCHPKPDSYVVEWVALQFNPVEGILPLKIVLKDTPWSILEATLLGSSEAFVIVAQGAKFWRVNSSDWVVKSPYGNVYFMSQAEFESNFTWRPEA